MGKESYWFKHDHNARGDEKILELRSEFGAEGYGVFWMIVETMAENSNGGVKASLIGGLSLGYGVAKDRLQSIFDVCTRIGLFFEKEGYYFSNRVLEHKESMSNFAHFGKIGAEKRWGGYRGANAGAYAYKNRVEREERKKEEKGVVFFLDERMVAFENGDKQELTEQQIELIKAGKLKPNQITKNH